MLRPTKPLSSYTKTVLQIENWQQKREKNQNQKQKQKVERKQRENPKENHLVVMQLHSQDDKKR